MRPLLACSCTKPWKQTLPWARHSKQLLFVCHSVGDSGPHISMLRQMSDGQKCWSLGFS